MAGRGSQTFKKRQREQQRKEKQQEKFARRMQRKENRGKLGSEPEFPEEGENLPVDAAGETEPTFDSSR
jgi:hypothetical protein